MEEIQHQGVEDLFVLVSRRPGEEIPAYLCSCQAAFVSFMNNDLFAKTIPAKLQSYMACGMPIIASATGETERIIREADCGVCAKIGDAMALSEAIVQLLNKKDISRLGINAKAYCDKHFKKVALMDEMDKYFGE